MWFEIFLGLVALFLALYVYVTKNFGRWKDLKIPYAKPSFPMGSFDFFFGGHIDIQSYEQHKKFENEKYFGHFMFGKPFIGVNDPDVLRLIQVKDFDHFVDRVDPSNNKKFFSGGETDQLWGKQLTSLTGEEWKDVRQAFSPIFTSGKMKHMMKFIQHVSNDLVGDLDAKAKAGNEFEAKSVFGKFSIDALASSAFGVNAESFKNEDSVFVKHAARIFKTKALDMLALAVRMIPGVPSIFTTLNISTTAPEATRFFVDIIKRTIKMRRQSNERKNDLIDLMLDAIKEDNITEEEEEPEDQYEKDMKMKKTGRRKQLDEDNIVATAMVLLVAGYDTTGMTLSYMAYQLSINPEVQQRLQEEIDEAFDEAGGKFPDYNVIQSLPYLDQVIHETLRFYTPIGMNLRAVEKDYKLPDSNIFLKKGDGITYNARFFHFNPKYWSHPDEFYPEHFSKEEKAARNP